MKTLANFIANQTPKFNKFMVEGYIYHKLKNTLNYINSFIEYTIESKTDTHLKYLGYKVLTPDEEIKFIFSNKSQRITYDIAENNIYLVEYYFQYGNEEEIRKYQFYLPYIEKGNIIHLSGNKFLLIPILSDKVLSIGTNICFINVLTAKYSFTRTYFSILVNGVYNRITLIITELYKNQKKKHEDTTKAYNTVMHYLLGEYGYSKTMELLLGFVPTPVYDYSGKDKVVLETTGNPPHGYIKDKTIYKPSKIKFLVDKEKYSEDVLYAIGNIFYIIDNFPDIITIDELDNTFTWKRLLGEIIHSGHYGLSYLKEKIFAHYADLKSRFDPITLKKLKDINIQAETLIELLLVIFKNFNYWIINDENKTYFNNKSYEAETFVLSFITSRITRCILDIYKEELRVNNNQLDSTLVNKIFKKYFLTRAIFSIKKEKQFVTSIEYSGDHLYFKNTAMVIQQESDFVNVQEVSINTLEKKKMNTSMAAIGSILGLSKKNPIPVVRLNPYVNVDFDTGTVLPFYQHEDLIEKTDKLLTNTVTKDEIDETDDNFDNIEDVSEDYDEIDEFINDEDSEPDFVDDF